ncbi:MAG: proline dehydrogenase family protein [Armatimonadetes bacterium]|nr:proline dehydrogenase family protein [Armatimonadota bacterium]
MSLGRTFILKTSALKPVESLVRKSFLFRPVVKRFIAGDTLEDAMKAAEELAKVGLMSSLDYLGENTASKEEALSAIHKYKEMLTRIGKSEFAAKINISIKLTQCGLDQGLEFAEGNYREVLRIAAESDTFVRVDMEASRKMIALGARVREVKWAYLEPAAVAFPEKGLVDQKFVEMAKLLLKEGNYPAIATHDENIINVVKTFAQEQSINKARFEFQMLYGIRRDLQDSLLAEGYNVRVYIPFGDQWYPYFTRRLAERPANFLFILKSFFKG